MDCCQPVSDRETDEIDEMAGLPLRRVGRVIVLDPDDRVLLLRYDQGPPTGRHWATPGGGLDPGESYAAAASRELAEQTGRAGAGRLLAVNFAARSPSIGSSGT